MKKLLILCSLIIAVAITSNAQATENKDSVYMFCYFKASGDGLHYAYSKDGYNWLPLFNDSPILKPTVSKDKLFRDPCIIKGKDGQYHMVWTVSWNDRGIGYASSKDLLHWSEQKYIPVMEYEDSAKNSWAPEITFDGKRTYMIYWASTIKGRFPQIDTSAEGLANNHRIYYTTTKNFKKFKKTKLLYDPTFSVIDATIVKDNKRYIMFLKNETKAPAQKNLRIAYSDKLTGPYTSDNKIITGKYWAEGPTALRIEGKWIVYFDKYRDHQYGAVESTDLVNWTDVSTNVKFPKGIRHGSAFSVSQEEFDKLVSDIRK